MVTFGSHVGNHQFQPFLSGVYAGVIFLIPKLCCIVMTSSAFLTWSAAEMAAGKLPENDNRLLLGRFMVGLYQPI